MHRGRGRHPKIAHLLGLAEAALVRDLVATARNLRIAPTIFAGIRLREQTFVYDEDGRVAKTIDSPDFIAEDHALLLGLDMYEKSLCRCGISREVAWHSEMDGWFEAVEVKCFACTAQQGGEKPVTYSYVIDTYHDGVRDPLPPFVMGLTTTDS